MARSRLVYHDIKTPAERRAEERRKVSGTGPNGVERRKAERRAPKEKLDGLTLTAIVLGLLMVAFLADSWLWHSYYREHVTDEINQTAAELRVWTDGFWKT